MAKKKLQELSRDQLRSVVGGNNGRGSQSIKPKTHGKAGANGHGLGGGSRTTTTTTTTTTGTDGTTTV
jgi:hypothetical protein